MNNEALRTLVAQGVAAMKEGGKVAAAATGEIRNDARHPDLKAALEKGNQTSQLWAQRIDQALQEAGGSREQKNPVLKVFYEVSRKIRQQAPENASRDLGIIAIGQLALHYWIAAFGTIRTYAAQLGMSGAAQAVQTSLNEAKTADEHHNEIAKKVMAA